MSDVPTPSTSARPCTGCGRNLPRTAEFFQRDALALQGLKRRCRDCCNAAERARYARVAPDVLQRKREARTARAEYFATQPHWKAA